VAAASDLYHAFAEMGEAFTDETGTGVEFTFGSTGLLTQQIQEGAPFDLFAAAHESYIDRLVDADAVLSDSKEPYALGRLVVLGDVEGDVEGGQLLLDPEIKTITIANPEHAPYGKAAKETLESWGIWDEVEPKLVYAENIRQAYQYIESGNADVGIVALALVNETDIPSHLINEETHQPITQTLGIPTQSANEEASRAFAEFILSQQGKEILQAYGFDQP